MFNKKIILKDLGSGLAIAEDAFDIDQKFLFDYINWLKKQEEDTFTYIEEDGKRYAINRTGFKFDLDSVSMAPERFVDPLCKLSDRKPTEEQQQLIHNLEDLVYKSLVEYCKIYTEASTVCWWRSPGHIATYSNGQSIGQHCDDQIPYEYGKPPKNEYPKHSKVSINIYLNDGVESEEELDGTNFIGGDIFFKHANYTHKPKAGTIAIYPTNYIGTHEVYPVTRGKRIAYLAAISYGTPDNGSPIPVEGESRIWMPNLRKDAGLEWK
jgi:hypothetical protein